MILDRVQAGALGVLEGCREVEARLAALPPDIARSESARVLVGVASEIDAACGELAAQLRGGLERRG